jgi:hypothetical protein
MGEVMVTAKTINGKGRRACGGDELQDCGVSWMQENATLLAV